MCICVFVDFGGLLSALALRLLLLAKGIIIMEYKSVLLCDLTRS